MCPNTPFTLQAENPVVLGIGQLPSDASVQTCDTVAKHQIPCACYGNFKMCKASEFVLFYHFQLHCPRTIIMFEVQSWGFTFCSTARIIWGHDPQYCHLWESKSYRGHNWVKDRTANNWLK